MLIEFRELLSEEVEGRVDPRSPLRIDPRDSLHMTEPGITSFLREDLDLGSGALRVPFRTAASVPARQG